MADIATLKKGDILYDKHQIYNGDHWHHVVVKVLDDRVDTLENNNNISSLEFYEVEVMEHLSPEEYGDDEYLEEIKRGDHDHRFSWGPELEPISPETWNVIHEAMDSFFKENASEIQAAMQRTSIFEGMKKSSWSGGRTIAIPFPPKDYVPKPFPDTSKKAYLAQHPDGDHDGFIEWVKGLVDKYREEQ